MKTSESINEIAAAMAKAQGRMRPALKDATNPAYRSKYADLTSVWEACREPLTTQSITVWQDVESAAEGVAVTTRLVHASGQWVEFGPLVVPLAKKDAHGVGSATSYAKRYALSAAVGIVADDDDDGNAASQAVPAMTRVPTRVAPPAGYENWLIDLTAVADEGNDALKAMWTASKPEYRSYLATNDASKWATIKAHAAKAGGGVTA